MKIDYQKKLDEMLEGIEKSKKVPKLLLHACCGPCSSYCIEYLSKYFDITIYYYNPNIEPKEEFDLRVKELEKLINKIPHTNKLDLVVEHYDPKEYHDAIKGYEHLKEGSERCFKCYDLRMNEAGKYASTHKYDYFTTTLSISPYKNAEKLNEIGELIEKRYNIKYLYADFKKKNGYKRSIELSKEYVLYRQDYCGCGYSKKEALERRKNKEIKSGIELVMNRDRDVKIRKNDYKNFPLIRILIILLLIAAIIYACFNKKENTNPKTLEPKKELVVVENSKANVDEYYFYGDHLNIKGTLETEGFGVKKVSLLLVGDNHEYEYNLNYGVNSKGITFYASTVLNEGIDLDNIEKDKYNMYIVLINDTNKIYFNLINNTNYKETTYYTVTSNNSNNKIVINTKEDVLYVDVVSPGNDIYYDIVIDPGHGGEDSGACLNKKLCETNYTLDLSKELKDILESKGYKVLLTRNSEITVDKYGDNGRVNIAGSSKAKLLFSIHLNSNAVKNSEHGFELYTPYNVNYDFATAIVNNLINVGGVTTSTNAHNKVAPGIYTRTFASTDVHNINKDVKVPYTNISTKTNYYFMIRETGGYMAGAYVDGQENEGINYYRNSNTGLESYIYEMAFINNNSDVELFKSYKSLYIKALAEAIDNRLK